MSDTCCQILRGDISIGPAVDKTGRQYASGTGYGSFYGAYYGGHNAIDQTLPRPSMPSPMRLVGDAANFSIDYKYQTIEAATPNSIEFPNACNTTTLHGVTIKMTLRCASIQNAALHYGLAPNSQVARAVTNEKIYLRNNTAGVDDLINFAGGLIDQSMPVVVEKYNGTTNTVVATLVDGVDFVIRQGGLRPLKSITTINAEYIRVSYTTVEQNVFDISTFSNTEHAIQFTGKNIAEDGDTINSGHTNYQFYNVKLTPDGTQDVLTNDKFQEITFVGVVNKITFKGQPMWFSELRVD
jgi:hypothetical protein